jgi:hypothetical protein
MKACMQSRNGDATGREPVHRLAWVQEYGVETSCLAGPYWTGTGGETFPVCGGG